MELDLQNCPPLGGVEGVETFGIFGLSFGFSLPEGVERVETFGVLDSVLDFLTARRCRGCRHFWIFLRFSKLFWVFFI